jgi:hypothetical protein
MPSAVDPKVSSEIISYLADSDSPRSMEKVVKRIRAKFSKVSDNDVKLVIWQLTGNGVAQFGNDWKVSIPQKHKKYAKHYAATLVAKPRV